VPGRNLRAAWLRSGLATAAMCAALPWLRVAGPDDSLLARGLGNVLLPIAGGMVVYVLAHWLLRSPELRVLRRRTD